MQFNQRVAMITGSGRGIGEGIAKRLGQLGVKVVVNDIDKANVDRVVGEIKDSGGEAMGITFDITKFDEIGSVFNTIIEQYGKIDILVNNAGIAIDKSIRKLTESDWDKVLTLNLKAAFMLSKAAIEYMVGQSYGRIVNISSRAWLGGPGQTNYSASKGGLVSMTRTLALELGKRGITVNCIAPGLIMTPALEAAPDFIKEKLYKAQPTGKIGSPADIANAVAFFTSDDAGYITGQVLYVCGGKSLFANIS